ncbi:RHS repeat-associated core domain-containing protein [Escherichia sp. E1130]|uniref:RHS repeat-associated core domain-containing protein n=1 Tax=Escherichia sp. E1130 TaxID=2041645 RepID=UPI001081EFA3|nr:RHS repeat-associated core domain-containing protein [Escherichia sp. E1130]TGC20887.1 hypothetical protein CQJ27_25810 [Escherichia sp. E1130]TLI62852.1 RHS repeat protein [Escherichia sp. E1130]
MMTDIQPRTHTAVQASRHANTSAVTSSHRSLVLLRTPDVAEMPVRVLVTRTVADPYTRTTRLYGARKLVKGTEETVPDAVTMTALSGQPLSLYTADGDRSLTLSDVAGRPLWSRNAQGTATTVQYEDAGNGGRPATLTEYSAGMARDRVRERYEYHVFTDEKVCDRNLAGAMVEHYDNAGLTRPLSASISGQLLASEQLLLKPEVGEPDWNSLSEGDPATYLEAPLTVSGTYDATGAPLTQTNADAVTTVSAYDIRGTVSESRLQSPEGSDTEKVITLKDILYRADGVVLSQTAGNGVTEEYTYDPRTQYLSRHRIRCPAGKNADALLISDLHYAYDPAGNILSLEDKGTEPVWYSNRQATGLRMYEYDTLYRLTSAMGRERHPVDPDIPTAGYTWSPYTERYTYDDGSNLTQTIHTGGSGNRTVMMAVSESSNRAVMQRGGETPAPDTGFLAGGLQKQLSDGRTLNWHADGQLRQVSPVIRTGENQPDDTELYHYADGGTRTRKIRISQTTGGTQTSVTTYAGGMETRQRSLKNMLQLDIVITEGEGGRLIRDNLSGEVHLRYSFSDHLGSTGGETDSTGRVTSREECLPYGGSSGSVEESTEVTDRTRRYSGKERDATGLLYYGWRYYQPETGRWLSADPGGLVDGSNLFCFVRCRPIVYRDDYGLMMRGLGSFRRGRRPPEGPISRPTRVGGGEVSEEVTRLNEIYHRPREQENTDEEREGFIKTIENILKLHANAETHARSNGVDLGQTLHEYAEGGNGEYQKVNNFLRGIEQSENDNRDGEKLSKDLGMIVPYLADYKDVAYRAISVNKNIYSDKIRKGDIVKDKGYMSASVNVFNSRKWAEEWAAGDTYNPEQEINIFVLDNTVTKKVASTSVLADHLIVSPELEFEVTDISLIPGLETNESQPLKIITLSSPIYADKYKIKNIHSGDIEEKVDHRSRVQKLKFWK